MERDAGSAAEPTHLRAAAAPLAKAAHAACRAPAAWLLRALAVVSLGLAALGVFLPVLPTTPFLLLAAWAAARSSPRLAAYLESHPRFGSMLRDWRERGAVSRRAKVAATLAMAGSGGIVLATVGHRIAAFAALACMACVLAWLWLRPEPR